MIDNDKFDTRNFDPQFTGGKPHFEKPQKDIVELIEEHQTEFRCYPMVKAGNELIVSAMPVEFKRVSGNIIARKILNDISLFPDIKQQNVQNNQNQPVV